jgi:hypothetical protein
MTGFPADFRRGPACQTRVPVERFFQIVPARSTESHHIAPAEVPGRRGPACRKPLSRSTRTSVPACQTRPPVERFSQIVPARFTKSRHIAPAGPSGRRGPACRKPLSRSTRTSVPACQTRPPVERFSQIVPARFTKSRYIAPAGPSGRRGPACRKPLSRSTRTSVPACQTRPPVERFSQIVPARSTESHHIAPAGPSERGLPARHVRAGCARSRHRQAGIGWLNPAKTAAPPNLAASRRN